MNSSTTLPTSSLIPHPSSLLTSDHGLIYAALVTIPMTGAFAALQFYEWFGNDSILADTTLITTGCATAFALAAIGAKLARLLYLRRRKYAWKRLKLVIKALLGNALVYGSYLLIRLCYG